MLTPLTPEAIPAFTQACAHEHIFGSKALTALRAYGPESDACRFWHCGAAAALCLSDNMLLVSAAEDFPMRSVAELVGRERVDEVDSTLEHMQVLQRQIGGTLETSFFMEYQGAAPQTVSAGLQPAELPTVFDILQRSHEYYRAHLDYPSWSADLERKRALGSVEVWQLEQDGEPVGTGSIVSEDAECAVVGAVAVPPEYRHRGFGREISRFLTARILQKGKKPRLVSGYDAVAELYRQIGYVACGRWGELYL